MNIKEKLNGVAKEILASGMLIGATYFCTNAMRAPISHGLADVNHDGILDYVREEKSGETFVSFGQLDGQLSPPIRVEFVDSVEYLNRQLKQHPSREKPADRNKERDKPANKGPSIVLLDGKTF